MKSKSDFPLVSILCITYNHEKFIKQAIEGFLMQKTNFPFEIIIHDDASTDGTQDIIKTYVKKYPNLFRPIFQTENQYSKRKRMFLSLFKHAKGKYIALCEGDDYWIDPNKLQKQIDFLERNPKYCICIHQVKKLIQNTGKLENFYHNLQTLTAADVISHNTIPTCSAVFKYLPSFEYPKCFDYAFAGDWILWLSVLKNCGGKIHCLPDIMGVYRIHDNGVYSGKSNKLLLELQTFRYENKIRSYGDLNIYFDYRYNNLIKTKIAKMAHRIADYYLIKKDMPKFRYFYFLSLKSKIIGNDIGLKKLIHYGLINLYSYFF